MVMYNKGQIDNIPVVDLDASRNHWSKANTCGRCWLGPCMCNKVHHREHGVIPGIIKSPNDKRMVEDPALSVAKTIGFILGCRLKINPDYIWSEQDNREWWGEFYKERNKFALVRGGDGYYEARRIAP